MRFTWQMALMEAITDPLELIRILELDPLLAPAALEAAALFPLKVPRRFVGLMKKGDGADPLLRQVLPLDQELASVAGFVVDPLQEHTFNPLPGLLHKYHGRVLLTLTGACGVNCRYCFRRHFPYDQNQAGPLGREKILDYLACDPSITEVILSGGDPLLAPDQTITTLIDQLSAIPHVKRLRIHTRMPVMLPERITPSFVSGFTASRLQPVMVLHCNHPRELTDDFKMAMCLLRTAGVTLLNQSVLLAGVNDTADVLVALSEALFAASVLPYYLHIADKVQGTAHFDQPMTDALALHDAMSAQLPGYLVPRLVTEIPGCKAKTLVHSKYLYTGQS